MSYLNFIHLQMLGELRIIRKPFGDWKSQASVRGSHLSEGEPDVHVDSGQNEQELKKRIVAGAGITPA